MNVLVIPEDFRKDRFILEPIIEAMLRAGGKARANVRVCMDPLLGGVDQALSWERIKEILERYRGMVNLFFLIVDRDGVAGRRQSLDGLELKARAALREDQIFLGENAWQEVEVWILAGHDLPKRWKWAEIRRETHAKEHYFEPLAEARGLTDEPGGGRKTLAKEAAARYPRIRQLCSEDVAALERRLKERGVTS